MTYCIGIKVKTGLVLAADTRTSAGIDDVRVYEKLHSFEIPGERVFVLLSAGNLATTQKVVAQIRRDMEKPRSGKARHLGNVSDLFEAAEYIGHLSGQAQKQVTSRSRNVNVETTFILGGQIRGEEPSLYMIYPAGNCIAPSPEMPFLQIGETKYGKPILDRFINPDVHLNDAARCALVSLDSTMRSNLSVGPPVDIALISTDELKLGHRLRLDYDTPYYARLKEAWARQLDNAVRSLPPFDWETDVHRLTPQVQL